MRLLLVDFHDSYTYNVADLLFRALGAMPDVVPFDDPRLGADLVASYDGLVLSPGPGDPRRAEDVGVVPGLVAGSDRPVLGVCLGHQILALLGGGRVAHVPPRHGHVARLRHSGGGLFAGLPQGGAAVRYHSLAVLEPLPPGLLADAWAEDGTLMSLHATNRPWWGVQHHPESVCSDHGVEIVRAWARAAGLTPASPPAGIEPVRAPGARAGADARARLLWRAVPVPADLAAAHEALCGARAASFWLDSALVVRGRSRFSFIGHPDGSEVLVARAGGTDVLDAQGARTSSLPPGALAALRERLPRYDDGPPVPLRGGYVGYLGYEARREVGYPVTREDSAPEAVWMRASRYLAVDHEAACAWLVAEPLPCPQAAQEWMDEAERTLAALPPLPPAALPVGLVRAAAALPAHLADTAHAYRAKVARAQEDLRAGDSYEVCLTTRADAPFPATPAQLRAVYRRQRAANPAPHAALLVAPGVTVLSSSPERFVRVDPDGTVETKPIKGTVARDADPARDAERAEALRSDPKTVAELLMVVDLLRNDLARSCEPGSVQVPDLMVVESYETVHQLLSRVTGRLRAGAGALDVLAAAFPGGSMTGAPKARTMQIIDDLEEQPRGVYSGTLGYLSGDGGADLSIVIRTLVHTAETLSVGAGGAVVLDSTPQGELDEMLLKLAAPLAWTDAGAR